MALGVTEADQQQYQMCFPERLVVGEVGVISCA